MKPSLAVFAAATAYAYPRWDVGESRQLSSRTDSADCGASSATPSWTIENFQFKFDPVANGVEFPAAYNLVSMNITNQATGKRQECIAQVLSPSSDSSGPPPWTQCRDQDGVPDSNLQIIYDYPYHWLAIRQQWSCASGANYSAVAYKVLDNQSCSPPVERDDFTGPVPHKVGVYSCTADKLTLSGYSEPAPRLPHTDPRNHCTANSRSLKSLQVVSFQSGIWWEVPATGTPNLPVSRQRQVRFDVLNSAQKQFWNTTWNDYSNNNVDFSQCGGFSWMGLSECSYVFNNATSELTLKVTWYCDDTDPDHSVDFSAEAKGVLPLDCTTTPHVDRGYVSTDCALRKGATGSLAISDLTSKAGGPLNGWMVFPTN